MKLKNCPWCNEPPRTDDGGLRFHVVSNRAVDWCQVHCGNCGARGPMEKSKAKAREAWNDRA